MKNQIWNKEMECMPRKELEALQLERLKALVDYCDKNVKFYHKRFEKAGITAEKSRLSSASKSRLTSSIRKPSNALRVRHTESS